MKKLSVALLLVLIAVSFAFAAQEPVVTYDDINFAYLPTSARYDAMGQSGIAYPTRLDGFYLNPAFLSNKGFRIDVPKLSVSYYNLAKLMENAEAMDSLGKILNGTSSDDDVIRLATAVLDNLGSDHNLAAKADVGISFKAGSFGFGLDGQVKIHSLNSASGVTDQSIIPEANIAVTLGYGMKIIDNDNLSLSAGISLHGVLKAYYKGVKGGKILEIISGGADWDKLLLWDTPVMGGWALPFDLGVNLDLCNDQLRIAATANNINGRYYMKSYSGVGYLLDLSKPADAPARKDSLKFQVRTPWSLNLGLAYTPDVDVIHPVLSFDIVDINQLFGKFGSESFRASDILLHLNAGAEIGLFDVLTIKAGINRGFVSLGAALWLKFAQIDVAYGWQEFGAVLGDKPVDCLTLRIVLGYDK